jgi:ribonuclease HI
MGSPTLFYQLKRLARDRVNLLTHLAPLKRRVSPENPRRSKIEHERTVRRKQLLKDLEALDKQIVAVAVQWALQKSKDPNYRRTQQRQYRRERSIAHMKQEELDNWD